MDINALSPNRAMLLRYRYQIHSKDQAMRHTAFISYSSKDSLPIEICNQLERRGAQCWIAPRDIPKGTPYARAIMKGISESDVVMVFISANSLTSEDVLNEIDNAHGMHKTIIPVFIENVSLNPEFSYYLKRKQWVNCFEDFNACINDLAKTLNLCRETDIPTISQPPFSSDYFFERITNPKEKTNSDKFLMPVEDVFSITGRGTVATGRIEGGTIKVGEKVWIKGLDKSSQSIVVGIEMSGKLYDSAETGDECGFLLRGIDEKDVTRGMVVSKTPLKTVKEFSAAIYLFEKEECNNHDTELAADSYVKIYNRTNRQIAKVIATSGGPLTNGDYGPVRFRVPKDICLGNNDIVVLKHNNTTIGVGLTYGLDSL